ncbi:ferredoxin [Nocardia xishanensis]
MRIEADREVCIGSGQCARLLPRHFEQSEDSGTVVVVDAEVNPADAVLHARLAEVRDSCPVAAIEFEATGERSRNEQ